MKSKRSACLWALAIIILIPLAGADFWTSTVTTNTSSWSIYRQSGNFSFDLSSAVEGEISPVDYRGRVLSPYHSRYEEIEANDVRLMERTAAREGMYRSEDSVSLQSSAESVIEISVVKPKGTEVYTIDYEEQWPVLLLSRRALEYSGMGINERELGFNNGDYVRSSLLYNRDLSKERGMGMLLERMNATLFATNDSIIEASFEPVKYTGYSISTETSGIADLGYRHSGPDYINNPRSSYETLNWNEERYYGSYDIFRSVTMDSQFLRSNQTNESYEWIPCGCDIYVPDMSAVDRIDDVEIFGQ